MEPLARRLHARGFATCSLAYAGTRRPIEDLAATTTARIARFAGNRTVHLVTHSMGGILARAMLANQPDWRPGRMVQLAPPNHGSPIVDAINHSPLLSRILGPAGRSLGTRGLPADLPPPPVPTVVIMGDHPRLQLFANLLGPANDGIVSVSSGLLPGLHGFGVVPADHTMIPAHPVVIEATLGFLETGVVPPHWRAPGG